ncbi:MAG: 2-succinyl-5-enolpyruvyl-6-hydroxy-3-cyclohexene-1-carboxylic-acid synthase [Planctomycetes bacterium]|nr:2-succinyl-5-enolpyruvyl-6-hydroxy-3-cyclohexene-1-carboxylic-acid synthase [Planctomycetota bacterium]
MTEAPDHATRSENVRRANGVLANTIAKTLWLAGCRRAVVAPGSRSTPLVLAFAACGFDLHVVHDERSGAFVALGTGRATETPGVVITTSGTATANLFPAIVEAAADHVPLLVLTADRPLELVGSGANQTIAQHGMYGTHVLRAYDLSSSSTIAERHIEARIRDGYTIACSERGPVHINVRFDKPLEIDVPENAALSPGRERDNTSIPRSSSSRAAQPNALPSAVTDVDAVVVGRLATRRDIAAAHRIVRALGVPTHASITSGVRDAIEGDVPGTALLADIDSILEHERLAGALLGDRVLWLGGPVVSTRLGEYLVDAACTVCRIGSAVGDGNDAASEVVRLPLDSIADSIEVAAEGLSTNTPRRQEALVLARAVGRALESLEPPLEARIARSVAASTTDGGGFVLANSSPIRDVDRYVRALPASRSYCNRGVSGIDGTLSTAYGIALTTERAVTVLTGDLSFLYDSGSLSAMDASVRMRIVVIDNHGGGLFDRLPIAACDDHRDVFERCIVAPHRTDLVGVAVSHGFVARRVETIEALEAALRNDVRGIEVLVFPTDRAIERSARARYRDAARTALASLEREHRGS